MDMGSDNIYLPMALAIIILWIAIVVGYFAWAIYFYNINLGLTNKDWDEIRQQRDAGVEVEAREHNPFKEETLGLPPGTVRGIMAMSLLIGALAMMIAALGGNKDYDENKFFIENFEFFTTAFLMMIAFYFGDKSLKYLRQPKQGNDNEQTENYVSSQFPGTNNPANTEQEGREMMDGNVDPTALKNELLGAEENEEEQDDDQDDFDEKGSEG